MRELLEHFPEFDYRKPQEPWRVSARANGSLAVSQIQAFHYHWALAAARSGHIGLAIGMEDLPFCLHVGIGQTLSNEKSHLVVAEPFDICRTLHTGRFSFVVVSRLLSMVSCNVASTIPERIRARCSGSELIAPLRILSNLLLDGGVLIGAVLDEQHLMNIRGSGAIESYGFQHTWSAEGFERNILSELLTVSNLELIEFDTLQNDLAFNFVVAKKLAK